MRVRMLDAGGDMTFGGGAANFHTNTPAGVAQRISTRLRLILGEWYLDTTVGTDWGGKILGRHGTKSYDAEIKRVILGTAGVSSIASYSSALSSDRELSVSAAVLTTYSATEAVTIAETLAVRVAS